MLVWFGVTLSQIKAARLSTFDSLWGCVWRRVLVTIVWKVPLCNSVKLLNTRNETVYVHTHMHVSKLDLNWWSYDVNPESVIVTIISPDSVSANCWDQWTVSSLWLLHLSITCSWTQRIPWCTESLFQSEINFFDDNITQHHLSMPWNTLNVLARSCLIRNACGMFVQLSQQLYVSL